jgi:uncharacterized protein YjbJ (UPF0337 family)
MDKQKAIARTENTTKPGAHMNKDQVKGSWEQVKGRAKSVWGELTDDDFIKADGNTDKLYGIIQSRFGDTKEVIKGKLDKLSLS